MNPRRQLGLLWGAVATAVVALSPLGPWLAPALPACPLKTLTGFPCPTCGATRTALALAHFDLLGAFAVSPLATLAWVVFIVGGLVAGVAALIGHALPEPPWRLGWRPRLALIVIVAANWVYLVWHGT